MAVDLDSLNDAQREAVLYTEGPLLVLAGAGSGKTRVLTQRIAHLVEDLHVSPWEILAITFTNKAAREMRERLGALVGPAVRGMWVSTFHSMCVRILRGNASRIGFTNNFTIYNEEDSKRLIKEIMAERDVRTDLFPIPVVRSAISRAKNELELPEDYSMRASTPHKRTIARIYRELQRRLKAANAFDFDDLLLYTHMLFENHEDVREAYQQRFRYILVDEYQDTNRAQYAITQSLAASHHNIMVVGDDDQSIYSWRGADIRNILEFEEDYPDAHIVTLEQNYRSTSTILEAANAVIAHNEQRKPKRLVPTHNAGAPIAVYAATDERDEGRWIAAWAQRIHREGVPYSQIAVFYRTNVQSRVLEDMLLRAGIPYRIVGGTRFFDRAEIRDVMAYLTLVVNPADDVAARRIINTPKRQIGKSTVEYIDRVARDNAMTFLEAAQHCITDESLRSLTRNRLASFVQLIQDMSLYTGNLRFVVEMIIDKAGLISALKDQRGNDARSRVENIKEFLSVVTEYVATHDAADALYDSPQPGEELGTAPPTRLLAGDSLADFIEWVSLRTDLDTTLDGDSCVTLMTIHSAKGLEFDYVFVAGMEEGLFPHSNSLDHQNALEEERRLAYVAITRARKKLFLTCALKRYIRGQNTSNPPSRFLGEIPSNYMSLSGLGSTELIGTGWEKRGSRHGIAGSGVEAGGGRVFSSPHEISGYDEIPTKPTSKAMSARGQGKTPVAPDPSDYLSSAVDVEFEPGDTVEHKVFGRGEVRKVDGDTLVVEFIGTAGSKALLKNYAPLVKIKS